MGNSKKKPIVAVVDVPMLVNLHYSMHLPERRFPLSKILLALQEIEFMQIFNG